MSPGQPRRSPITMVVRQSRAFLSQKRRSTLPKQADTLFARTTATRRTRDAARWISQSAGAQGGYATDHEALGLFAYAKRDWEPGDIIHQGSASLRVVDVIEPMPRFSDGVEVGVLMVAPLEG
jgi:hypothetical protein